MGYVYWVIIAVSVVNLGVALSNCRIADRNYRRAVERHEASKREVERLWKQGSQSPTTTEQRGIPTAFGQRAHDQ